MDTRGSTYCGSHNFPQITHFNGLYVFLYDNSKLKSLHHIGLFINCDTEISAEGLTHISLASFLWDIHSAKPDQMAQKAASDQVFLCLLAKYYIGI